MTISEKVAYLKGVAEGLDLDIENSKEGKLLSIIIGILEEVGLSIEDLEENSVALGEEIDALSDDLSEVEEVLFGDEEEDEESCDCDSEDCEDFFEVNCPSCSGEISVDAQVLKSGEVECPQCGDKFSIDARDAEGCGCCGTIS